VPELPSGSVTFLFTDIEGSTPLAERLGDGFGGLLVDHRILIRAAVAEAGGVEVDCRADEFFGAFTDAEEAVKAALSAQRAFQLHQWPDELQLGVRNGYPHRKADSRRGAISELTSTAPIASAPPRAVARCSCPVRPRSRSRIRVSMGWTSAIWANTS